MTKRISHEAGHPGHAEAWFAFAPMSDQMRANAELATRVSMIVARATQAMAARQSAVIAEAVNDLAMLMRAAAPNAEDPTAFPRAYSEYAQAVLQRAVAQLNFSVQTVSEMSASALDLAQSRIAKPEPVADAAPSNGLAKK